MKTIISSASEFKNINSPAYFTFTITESKRKFKLSQSKDWNIWLSIVKVKAIDYKIWSLINSSKNEKSEEKLKFIKFVLNYQISDTFVEKHVRWQNQMFIYKKEL